MREEEKRGGYERLERERKISKKVVSSSNEGSREGEHRFEAHLPRFRVQSPVDFDSIERHSEERSQLRRRESRRK